MATSDTPVAMGGSSSEILLSAALPDLFLKNAFRVTGLAVEATAGDIARQAEKLRMAGKYGGTRFPSPLPLMPPPDADQIREAVDRLRDPERRLVDEFFWFWPHKLGGSRDDEALSALCRGEVEHAAGIWERQESNQSVSNVSMHNLAVLMHARALDLELQDGNSGDIDPLKREELWESAYLRWVVLLDDEAFWSRLTARIRALDDPRLTTGTARRMRTSLPLALLLINAQLAMRSAEAGNAGDAKQHLGIMKASGFGETVMQEALRRAVQPIRDRIKTLCRAADKETDVHPERGDEVTEQLLAQTVPLLAILDLLLPAGSPPRDGAHDEVAVVGLRCQIGFGNKTRKWKKSVALLEALLPIAASTSARSRIEENLVIVRTNRELNACFFCGDGEANEKCGIEKKMFGNVTRTPKWGIRGMGTEISWHHRTITVPRCQNCKSAQSKTEGWIAAAVITSILTGMGSCGIASNLPDENGLAALMLFGFGIGGSLIGSLLARLYFCRNTRPSWQAKKYKEIQKLLKEGWQFGTKPVTQS